MKFYLINIFILLLILSVFQNSSHAKDNIKMLADVDEEFTLAYQDLPDEIQFSITQSQSFSHEVTIPENSRVTLEVIRAQRELRWHKSGLILCRLKNYTPEGLEVPVDLSDKNIYVTVKKHEEINKKEAILIGTELVLAQGAGFFAPGADIGYFFIKGAIQRKKHPNWFKAGVHNAYDNSIFWFCQKGKPIELTDSDQVKIQNLKAKNVDKVISKIDKRNARFERQALNRISKQEAKALKRNLNASKNLADCSVVEEAIENIVVDRSVLAEILDKNADN